MDQFFGSSKKCYKAKYIYFAVQVTILEIYGIIEDENLMAKDKFCKVVNELSKITLEN